MIKHYFNDSHVSHTIKSFLKALYATTGVFLLLFVSIHIGGALYTSSIEKKSAEAFHYGINNDLSYLKEQGDIVSKNELLIQYLLKEDSEKLVSVMQKERSSRNIGLMGVANKEGIIIGRTKTLGKIGDNAFLINPVGRVVAKGQYSQSVEAPIGFDPRQIFLTTARPIFNKDQMVGALFANYLTDDDYAQRFKDNYLPQGVEVVFYNKNAGVYGDSFSNTETRKLINSYFNSNSDWIKNGFSGKTISFNDDNFYLVQNIIFPGLENSPGGALIFIPRKDFSGLVDYLTVFIVVGAFILLVLRYHKHSTTEETGWRYYILVIIFSVLIFFLSLLALRVENVGYLQLKKNYYPLYNSTIRIQPEFGIYDLNFEQRFSVMVDTGDESVNAVQIQLLFDPKRVEIKSLETSSSSCSYVIENKIDSIKGKADLSCVMIKTDGEQGTLPIADIIVVPKQTGNFTFSFDEENTKVLASDGLGTNVLRMSQSSSYQVINFNPKLSTSTKPFVVFSPTHPNQSRWYNLSTASFVWFGKPNAVYRYTFDSSPDTVPSNTYTTKDTKIDVPIPGDGVFYFHLQLASGGPVTHYRLQSDETPPSIVSIHLSQDNIKEGDVVRFSFEAKDVGSGIQQNYYVDLGNHLFLPTGSQLYIPFLEPGDQKVTLRVYDLANNYSEKTQIVHVESK